MDQVFTNCRLYNGIESPVGKMGIRVHNEYKSMLTSMRLVERFGDEKEALKFTLDDASFEPNAGANDAEKEVISDSELPADSIGKMNERTEQQAGENNGWVRNGEDGSSAQM